MPRIQKRSHGYPLNSERKSQEIDLRKINILDNLLHYSHDIFKSKDNLILKSRFLKSDNVEQSADITFGLIEIIFKKFEIFEQHFFCTYFHVF